ncbi:geranylgeranyl pyrophosphate synthase isoform X3 [Aplysia californica]|uniref:Geranylgeranyl pyrophosphate synthase isoform X3 n=1 Tax=Aplysia californica TaxID=6500 RepID=A0ABM1W137_APLCA|nr:geranylgeranyl pyrophosphate synthase isoform X3 [Aplysia californica]
MEVPDLASAEQRNSEKSKMEDKQERILLSPYKYICQIPGKQIRTKLSVAFNHWLQIPEDKLKIISDVIQMLHNASLIIDDIEDNSKLRRGIPEHLLELHRGQGMDIYWRDAVVCPTEEEYRIMVIRKTGGLFGLAVELMQLFSENKSNFKPLLDTLGLYFQIRDDYANLSSKEYEANKSYCEDLTEGKFSFPIIHAVRANPDDTQVLSILRQRTTDNDIKKYCVEYMERMGSFEYTRNVLMDLEKQLVQEIASLGENPYLTGLVSELRKIYTLVAGSSS